MSELATVGRDRARVDGALLIRRASDAPVNGIECPRALRGCLLGMLEAAPGIVLAATSRGRLLYINAMGRTLLGIERQENVVAHRLAEFYSPRARAQLREEAIPTCLAAGLWRGETTLLDCERREVSVAQVLMAHRLEESDGRRVTVLSGIAWDIREHKRTERQLRHQATHDALTGLPNRVLLIDRLTQAIRSAERHRRQVGVLFLDLDGFKQINDDCGHEPANLLLRELGGRLRACVRAEDTVARYGGDEFVLVEPDLGAPDDIERGIRLVAEALREPFTVAGRPIRIAASVGAAIYPHDGSDAETLLRKADLGMYAHKRRTQGGDGPIVAAPDLRNLAALACNGRKLIMPDSV